jgi:hypothetical protein
MVWVKVGFRSRLHLEDLDINRGPGMQCRYKGSMYHHVCIVETVDIVLMTVLIGQLRSVGVL